MGRVSFWRIAQFTNSVISLILILLALTSTPTNKSIAVVVGTKDSDSAGSLYSTPNPDEIQLGLFGFCKREKCLSYREFATSPAAIAAARVYNQTNRNTSSILQKASVESPGESEKENLDRAGFTVLEKMAVYCISGSGPSLSNRTWLNLLIILIVAALLMLILCALLVMMMLPDKRDRSYSDRSYSREEDLNKGIRYFSIGLHIVGFVSIFAAFFVTLIPFQKARGKLGAKQSWGIAFWALVAAVFLTFASIVAEALHTNSTLRARNRKRAKQTDLYDEGRSEPYDQYQFR